MDAAKITVNASLPNGQNNTDVITLQPRRNVSSDKMNISQISEFERIELPVSERVLIEAIEKANKSICGGMRKFEFSIHEQTKQIMVKVLDSETNEVIREIPPEKILDMVAKMWELAGLIVDERR